MTLPADLCYLYGSAMEDYLHDMEIGQRFARRSREKMADIIGNIRETVNMIEILKPIYNFKASESLADRFVLP